MQLSDFRIGDQLILTGRTKQGEERRTAVVTLINYNNLGGVTYMGGDWRDGMLPSGQGWFDPAKVGDRFYGLVIAVENVSATDRAYREALRVECERPVPYGC